MARQPKDSDLKNLIENETGEDKYFSPPSYTKDGKPVCYGHFIYGRRCMCPYSDSCPVYTYSNKAMKSRDLHFSKFETVPIIDGMDWECPSECSGTHFDHNEDDCDFYDENEEYEKSNHRIQNENEWGKLILPDGGSLDISLVNARLMEICLVLGIERPAAAKALLLKMNPKVKSLQDIADIQGISKQAVQRRIANELGIGKRQFKENFLLSMSPREIQVFKLYFREKKSLAQCARILKITRQGVHKVVIKLRSKNIDMEDIDMK